MFGLAHSPLNSDACRKITLVTLIVGINQCAEGERKDARGDCKKTYDSGNRQNRRSPTTYGGGRRLRDVCCS